MNFMKQKEEKAYAKINLILDVLKKKKNGYHEIDFLMSTIDLYDLVKVQESTKDQIEVIDYPELSNSQNLAYQALQLIKTEFKISTNYQIQIIKNIPISAGMAGGSSDAAAVLRIVNELENLNLSLAELTKVGIKLGADVPFCLYSKPARAQGIGEKIEIISSKIPSSYVLVINPNKPLATKTVYENHLIAEKSKERKSISEILVELQKGEAKNNFYDYVRNDLESTACQIEPLIKEILTDLNKYAITSKIVSGSGPTVLAFSEQYAELKKIKEELQAKYKIIAIYKTRH